MHSVVHGTAYGPAPHDPGTPERIEEVEGRK
jgi:hypothetical protein